MARAIPEDPTLIHGTAICHAGKALLLLGPSGSGKSTLALQMIGMGAALIADDKVVLTSFSDHVAASCPSAIQGIIEARGVGIVNTPAADPTAVHLVVDLAHAETMRMPPQRDVTLLGHKLPLLWSADTPHFPATLLQILQHGRSSR